MQQNNNNKNKTNETKKIVNLLEFRVQCTVGN